MKKKLSIFDILYIAILLYVFSTVTQTLYPFSLNRIWTIGIIVCLLVKLLKSANKKTILYLIAICVVGVSTTIFSENIKQNINDFIYFATAVLWLIFMSEKKNRTYLYGAVVNNLEMTKVILILSFIAVLVPFVTKSGYSYQWGEAPYFTGYSGSQHTMASSMCLLTSVYLLLYLRKRFAWWHLVILMLCAYIVLETGARTFIVPIAILVFYYIQHNIKSINTRTLVYSIGTFAAIYMVLNSSMLDKFTFLTSGANMAVNAIDGFTSGRSRFWIVDLDAFVSGNFFQFIFGRGFDYVYCLNERMVRMKIWAHNDFIHLLLGGGFLAFSTYVAIMFNCFRNISVRQNKLDKILIVIYVLFPAVFNGFLMYQHLLLSAVFFCICYEYYINNKIKNISCGKATNLVD